MNDADKLKQIQELLRRWKNRRLNPELALVSIYNTLNEPIEGETFPCGGPFLVDHYK